MKEKTETENTSFNVFDTKKKTEVKSEVKKEAAKEVKQEVKETDDIGVSKKATDSYSTKLREAVEAKKVIQDINEMTDAEIEEYLKKRKAEHNAFKITSAKVPMNKLVQASVAPAPQMNPNTFMKNAIYMQNRLRVELDKKG